MKPITIAALTFVSIVVFGTGMYILSWKYFPSAKEETSVKYNLKFDGEAMYKVWPPSRSQGEKRQSLLKSRRSAIAPYWKKENRSSVNISGASETKVIRIMKGSPRFPNIDNTYFKFDLNTFSCNDNESLQCIYLTSKFADMLEKEFYRLLMSESKVFKSGLAVHNIYDVHFEGIHGERRSRLEILCGLTGVRVRTVTAKDEPFASLGFAIPEAPLQQGCTFNTCAVVTSSGALLGSRLGYFIDSHDMVLRFNNAPTMNYTEDVGSKTTFRVLNSQVVAKRQFNFLENSLYENISIIIWDPANYSSTLDDWYRDPDFNLFDNYKRFLEVHPDADAHLLKPQVLWDLWTVLQNSTTFRIRKNPPSSGFIGIWFAIQRCALVRVFEYVPSTHVTTRCHYYSEHRNRGCTLGSWHPLAQEKAVANQIRHNSDFQVFQKGYIEIQGSVTSTCTNG